MTAKTNFDRVILVSEDTGRSIEEAYFVAGKWDIHWTAVAAKARMFSPETADRISAELSEQGIGVIATTRELFDS